MLASLHMIAEGRWEIFMETSLSFWKWSLKKGHTVPPGVCFPVPRHDHVTSDLSPGYLSSMLSGHVPHPLAHVEEVCWGPGTIWWEWHSSQALPCSGSPCPYLFCRWSNYPTLNPSVVDLEMSFPQASSSVEGGGHHALCTDAFLFF